MNKELLAILLPIILQYTPTAIRDVMALIEGNPQASGESDADYIARMGALIDAGVAKIDQQDADIQK